MLIEFTLENNILKNSTWMRC